VKTNSETDCQSQQTVTPTDQSLFSAVLCDRLYCIRLTSKTQHLNFEDCLDVRREYNQNCLCCIVYNSCAQWYSHTCEQFLNLCLGLEFDFVCLFSFTIFAFFCVSCFCELLAFVVFCSGFSFFSTKPVDWPGRMSPKWPILCRVRCNTLTLLLLLLVVMALRMMLIVWSVLQDSLLLWQPVHTMLYHRHKSRRQPPEVVLEAVVAQCRAVGVAQWNRLH